ncbi:MAG: ROK family protein [Spirochaetaceae bacterium]|nr:MAG: ROK family protein [Spirochaetaceae bacterium]
MVRTSRSAADVRSAVFRLPLATRRTIAEYLNSSHVTVNKALQALEASGDIVATASLRANGSGRPSDVFSLRPDSFYGIGVHLEPGLARVVLLDAEKKVAANWSLPLPRRYRNEVEVQHTLLDTTRWAFSQASGVVDREKVVAIGFALLGFVDTAACVWRGGLQFGTLKNLDVKALLKEIGSVSIHIEDTSRSLTHFQIMTSNETQTDEHFVLINMGIGLGAGFVVNREVFLGNGGIVGEIGHIPFGNSTYRCACGNLGCAETMLSAGGMRNVFAGRLAQGVRSNLNDRANTDHPPTIREILESAEAGDHFTRSTLFELGAMLGDLVDFVFKCYTPGPVVLAGEGSLLSDYLIPAMTQTLSTKTLPEILQHHEVFVQKHDGMNEATGAGMLGMKSFLLSS